jgi:hypothetical protein
VQQPVEPERLALDDDMILGRIPVAAAPTAEPLLFVVVDTEEEFDWNAPFCRESTNVRAMSQIGRLQRLLDGCGLKPTYVIDFPVASQSDGYRPLQEIRDDGRCDIGAHLHPWVNPPLTEDVNGRNSFGCNLDAGLEFAKIERLRATIAESLGFAPRVYKAGRYGFGVATARTLERLEFDVDLSINPRMDFRPVDGPSFEQFDAMPFFFGVERRLLEIPCTTDYTGWAGGAGPALHRFISRPALTRARVPGVMARLRVVNKVMLTPEGSTLAELVALTRTLLRRGVRTFSLTLHSPSLSPGCTPYVRSERSLMEFLDRIKAYCEFFLGEVGGRGSTPLEFLASLSGRSAEEPVS